MGPLGIAEVIGEGEQRESQVFSMLTIFATGKAFRGHSGIIQRNAIASWKRLHADVEVILFGDDEGAAEIAREMGLRHEPWVERNEFGSKRLDWMFLRAQEIARHRVLCYSNCDIVLPQEFCEALRRVMAEHARFLMVGRRWDTDIAEPWDFDAPDADEQLVRFAREHGKQRGCDCVDYFAFRRGFFAELKPLVVGRIWWDHWLVWKARKMQGDVVDASEMVTAVHQNHDYGYHAAGVRGVWGDAQAKRNYELAGGPWHLHTIADATHILQTDGERANLRRWWAPYWRWLRPKLVPLWFAMLNATRPVRWRLGLRSGDAARLRGVALHQSRS